MQMQSEALGFLVKYENNIYLQKLFSVQIQQVHNASPPKHWCPTVDTHISNVLDMWTMTVESLAGGRQRSA